MFGIFLAASLYLWTIFYHSYELIKDDAPTPKPTPKTTAEGLARGMQEVEFLRFIILEGEGESFKVLWFFYNGLIQ